MIHVSHFVGLSGVGGVQKNFVEYFNNQATSGLDNRLVHKIYTLGKVDLQYQYKLSSEVCDIKNPKYLFSLILDIISRKNIVHFYNNLTSLKVVILLFLLPVSNLILHERGTIWNLHSSRGLLLRFVAWKAELILANSNATKIMLVEKFYIPNEKIRVLHNGIDTTIKCTKKPKYSYPSFFCIGFIGRLDTPKGVHVLIDAMHHLVKRNIKLIIAGNGVLENALKTQARDLKNISFVGRIIEPYSFLSSLDLLVVPSIREPLGNICLEAGLCKIPVLAANIDGIPEIIEHKVSGELIKATDEISIIFPKKSVPLPEFVVDPVSLKLYAPKQINSHLLARKILELSRDPERLRVYAINLYTKVIKYFNICRYESELHAIYHEVFTHKKYRK
jgi:glycosyltransferase involved in cell wall biosynthesis